MSERADLAERFAAFVRSAKLTNPFGGDVNRSEDKKYYAVLFSYPRLLDGLARIYGPKFILLEMQGPMVHGNDRFIFDSMDNALAFMRLAFVDHNWDAALEVPTKPVSPKAAAASSTRAE